MTFPGDDIVEDLSIENLRYQIQCSLDEGRTQKERNVLGQFSTPYPLAEQIMSYVRELSGNRVKSFLEPSIGTGVFYSALLKTFGTVERALGFEIDPYYFRPSAELWRNSNLEIRNADFLDCPPKELFSLIVANPPYSRHHHISSLRKQEMRGLVKETYNIEISGLSGLYCYFLILSTRWLEKGGLSCWLIPSEFMDVNYGVAVKNFLLNCVDLVSIHKFNADELQFGDVLVTSSVVTFKNIKPTHNKVRLSSGKDLNNPDFLSYVDKNRLLPGDKWNGLFQYKAETSECGLQAVIGDYFNVKRGIATGNNKFFIVDFETIRRFNLPDNCLTPILPAPRNLPTDEILSCDGNPKLVNPLFLVSSALPEELIASKYPGYWEYLQYGMSLGVPEGHNCKLRDIWYSCEKREAAPFLISYMGRDLEKKNIFRFILNHSNAIASNSYLMLYPKPDYVQSLRERHTLKAVWDLLRNIPKERLISCGRVYGGGLYKLEPKELMSVPICGIDALLKPVQKNLFD